MRISFVNAIDFVGGCQEARSQDLLKNIVYAFQADDVGNLEGDAIALIDFDDGEVYVQLVDAAFRLPLKSRHPVTKQVPRNYLLHWVDGLLHACHEGFDERTRGYAHYVLNDDVIAEYEGND